jgi:UDP:flavonoid glycosyltransferase YjiC (YdhE family)
VALEPLLPGASLVVAYGSGTVANALLAGVPLLLVPRWAEQHLTALRVEALGAGLVARARGTQPSFQSLLERLLAEPGYRAAARNFAARYSGYDAAETVTRIVGTIEEEVCHQREGR